MDYIAEKGDTFASIAAQYTIGGETYGIALERQNAGVSAAYEASPGEVITGVSYIIPEAWLKDVWKGVDQYGNKLHGPLTIKIKGAGNTTRTIDLTVPAIVLGIVALIVLARKK